MELIIHIGKEKTGSTSLQYNIFSNTQFLKDSLIYPLRELILTQPNRSFSILFERNLNFPLYKSMNINNKEQFNELKLQVFTDFNSQYNFARNYFKKMVISSEFLSVALNKREQLYQLKKFCDKRFSKVSVVCYFRDQFSDCLSRYSQDLKTGLILNLDDFMKIVTPANLSYNHFNFMNLWEETFGIKNMFAFSYFNEDGHPIDINKHFFTNFLPECVNFEYQPGRKRNLSLGWLGTNLHLYLNSTFPRSLISQKKKLLNNYFRELTEDRDIHLERIYHNHRDDIESSFIGSNLLFEKKYLNGKKLFKKLANASTDEINLESYKLQLEDEKKILKQIINN